MYLVHHLLSSCAGFTANRILTNFLKYLDYHQVFTSVCFLQLFSGDKSKSNFFVIILIAFEDQW